MVDLRARWADVRERKPVQTWWQDLRERRPIAYTTVMTLMRILERKGHLKVSRVDRAHVYRPSRPRRRVVGEMVREFVDRVFGGAPEPLIEHLVRDYQLTDRDLSQIVVGTTSRNHGRGV